MRRRAGVPIDLDAQTRLHGHDVAARREDWMPRYNRILITGAAGRLG